MPHFARRSRMWLFLPKTCRRAFGNFRNTQRGTNSRIRPPKPCSGMDHNALTFSSPPSGPGLFIKARVRVFIELKRTLGQDYPHVLRQIQNKIPKDEQPGEQQGTASELSPAEYFLVIQRYLPAKPPLEFVRHDFFGKHLIRLLLRSEIPA
jgi:hypothetical protein